MDEKRFPFLLDVCRTLLQGFQAFGDARLPCLQRLDASHLRLQTLLHHEITQDYFGKF